MLGNTKWYPYYLTHYPVIMNDKLIVLIILPNTLAIIINHFFLYNHKTLVIIASVIVNMLSFF